MDSKEIADGKVLAIIGYIFGIVAIVMLFVRNNNFVLYHAKQMLILTIAAIVCWIPLFVVLLIVAAAVPKLACLVFPLYGVLWIGAIVLVIIGIINAANGVCKPLPLIGVYGEKWFAGIKKQGA